MKLSQAEKAEKAENKDADPAAKDGEAAELDGLRKLFSFDNPDRYKTDQLKEQAMALLVPGYLQYVYDIN